MIATLFPDMLAAGARSMHDLLRGRPQEAVGANEAASLAALAHFLNGPLTDVARAVNRSLEEGLGAVQARATVDAFAEAARQTDDFIRHLLELTPTKYAAELEAAAAESRRLRSEAERLQQALSRPARPLSPEALAAIDAAMAGGEQTEDLGALVEHLKRGGEL